MGLNQQYSVLASNVQIEETIKSLTANGIKAVIAKDKDEAKDLLLKLIPVGSEVFTMTSMTLEAIGVLPEINESGKYQSVRQKLTSVAKQTKTEKTRQLGAAPDYAVGSVHAVTQDGHLIIASNTGSQLPGYAYAAGKVIFVVGTQKIVKNFNDGLKRIYEYTLLLENERAKKAYGRGSFVSKLLVINREIQPDRITVIFIKENLGF